MRKYLKTMRDEREITQSKLAETIGISQNYYCLIENGDRQQDMGLSIIEKLSAVLDVPLQTIIDLETQYISERKDSA